MSKDKKKIFSNGEINVSLIISLIRTRFLYLLSFIFASLIISVFIIKIQTQLYKTNISFTPSSSDPSTGVNDIMDLASTVGINLEQILLILLILQILLILDGYKIKLF